LIQINQIATDINKYRVIQTGAKTQSGGLKVAFAMVEYQGSLCILVIKPPQAEAPKARTTKINSEKIFLDKVIMQKLATVYNH
tara:strand:+ start:244 stop:492 length:249 start_codon:yes stop_codon:yes gene_type:complete